MKIFYYKKSTCQRLQEYLDNYIPWYLGTEDADEPPDVNLETGILKSGDEMQEYRDSLIWGRSDIANADISNSLTVFHSFNELSRHKATDMRLWVYETHQCRDYVVSRWLSDATGKIDIANNDDAATQETKNKIERHYFGGSLRSLLRSNAIARLWWNGKIAHETDPENPEQFLRILLKNQDIRQQIMERVSVASNMEILKTIYQVLLEDENTNNGALLERDSLRAWMRALNKKGGVLLLDALSESERLNLFQREAQKILEQHN